MLWFRPFGVPEVDEGGALHEEQVVSLQISGLRLYEDLQTMISCLKITKIARFF